MKVAVYSHNGFRWMDDVIEQNIHAGRVLNDSRTAFRTSRGAMFFTKAENGKHYNVGNKAFWAVPRIR